MKTRYATLYLVSVLVGVFEVRGKSLIFNKFSNGPHFGARKPSSEIEYDDLQDNDNEFSYKRSVDDILHPYKRSIFGGMRKRSPYGLVYNQGKPIGILEPIGQAFEYASYPTSREVGFRNTGFKSQWYPTKRESDFDIGDQEKDDIESQTSALHNSNYANVLAKFKVNNKVKQRPYQDFMYAQQVKRDVLSNAASTTADMSSSPPLNPSSGTTALEETDSGSVGSSNEAEALTNKKKESREDLKKRGAIDLGDLDDQVVKIDSGNKATKAKRKVEEKIDQIEENLKNVMDDMGLVDKESDGVAQKDETKEDNPASLKKREIYFEDEDLENGLNKIGLTKESHYDRNKKEDCPGKTKVVKSLKNVKKSKVEKSIHKKGKKKSKKADSDVEPKRIAKSTKRQKSDLKTMHVANYQDEGEEFIRRKRQNKDVEKDDSDIMKGLEVSGDLTVSGNKSPLVAVSNDENEKKSQEKRDKEELEYEKRLERNIEAKINAIKEEVKREISRLQTEEDLVTTPGSDTRRKREVFGNLMDEESSDLDPGINIEGKLEPHIRRRRNTDTLDDKRVSSEKIHQRANTDDNEPRASKSDDSMSSSKGSDDTGPTSGKMEDDNSIISKSEDNVPLIAKMEEDNAISRNEEESSAKLRIGESSLTTSKEDEPSMIQKRSDKPKDQPNSEESESELPKDKPVEKRAAESEEDGKEGGEDEDDKDIGMNKRHEKKEKLDKAEKEAKEEKMIDKRSASATTDKIEADIKTELGTDLPDTIVKREGDSVELTEKEKSDIDSVIADANSIVKREQSITTERFIIRNEKRSVDGKPKDISTGQTLIKDIDGDSFNRLVKDVKAADGPSSREQRNAAAEESSSKPITKNADAKDEKRAVKSNDKLHKRSTESKVNIQELDKPAASKSIILNDDVSLTADPKEPAIEQRSAKEVEQKEAASIVELKTEKTDVNILDDISQLDKEDNADVEGMRTVRKTDEDQVNLETKNQDHDELDLVNRRRRSLYNEMMNKKRINRKKRDGSWNYQKNQEIGYRADDGEIDDEDDEMQDDGFDDQTSNMVNKRHVDYEQNTDEEGQDYPTYLERNKRNALRLYDDETEPDESFDNFLFYPNRYSRHKRHNYDEMVHGGVGGNAVRRLSAARGPPFEQRLRRKRLEKPNRLRNQKSDFVSLSESDIFGGLPQSYEGELSRFKRVKRGNDNADPNE